MTSRRTDRTKFERWLELGQWVVVLTSIAIALRLLYAGGKQAIELWGSIGPSVEPVTDPSASVTGIVISLVFGSALAASAIFAANRLLSAQDVRIHTLSDL